MIARRKWSGKRTVSISEALIGLDFSAAAGRLPDIENRTVARRQA